MPNKHYHFAMVLYLFRYFYDFLTYYEKILRKEFHRTPQNDKSCYVIVKKFS